MNSNLLKPHFNLTKPESGGNEFMKGSMPEIGGEVQRLSNRSAILVMAHPYSRNRNRYRYRGRGPCFLVDFGPDPDLDPDSGFHN